MPSWPKHFPNLYRQAWRHDISTIFPLVCGVMLLMKLSLTKNPPPQHPNALVGSKQTRTCRWRVGEMIVSQLMDPFRRFGGSVLAVVFMQESCSALRLWSSAAQIQTCHAYIPTAQWNITCCGHLFPSLSPPIRLFNWLLASFTVINMSGVLLNISWWPTRLILTHPIKPQWVFPWISGRARLM